MVSTPKHSCTIFVAVNDKFLLLPQTSPFACLIPLKYKHTLYKFTFKWLRVLLLNANVF